MSLTPGTRVTESDAIAEGLARRGLPRPEGIVQPDGGIQWDSGFPEPPESVEFRINNNDEELRPVILDDEAA